MRAYAIGDIHGQQGELERAHRLIEEDRARVADSGASPVVHTGDLCDRGPDTSGVIAFLLSGHGRGAPWITLMGNHDWMMLDYLSHGPKAETADIWLHPRNGGEATLASYGVDLSPGRSAEEIHAEAVEKVPARHIAFLKGLPTSWRRDDLFFCHAGIRPGVPLDAQRDEDLLWIRGPFLHDRSDHGALIVHGHTPVDAITHYGNRLAIDTGAGWGRPLVPVVIEGRDAWALKSTGREPVTPMQHLGVPRQGRGTSG